MVSKSKKLILCLITLLLLLLCVVGCSNREALKNKNHATEDNQVTLRFLVENLNGRISAKRQIESWKRKFEKSHSNVEIILEELPLDSATNQEEREILLDQLSVEIMAGKGYDMYLIFTEHVNNPLFQDVNQIMRNGMFADLSEYYDADEDLNTAGLNQTVMSAGVVDGHRFTLPLRYDFPIASISRQAIETAGLSMEQLETDVIQMMETIARSGNNEAALSAYFHMNHHVLNFVPEVLDYENQKVLVTQEELTEILNSWVELHKAKLGFRRYDMFDYNAIITGQHWLQNGYSMQVSSLEAALYNTAFNKADGTDIEFVPLTGKDGKIVAEISCYAAVDANCEYPELAYEFLRYFLTEESQWETNVHTDDYLMFSNGYPVRTVGSVGILHQNVFGRTKIYAGTQEKIDLRERLGNVVLTDADIPILQAEIDVARYPITVLEHDLGYGIYLAASIDPNNVDVEQIVQDWLRELEFHLYEG